MKFLFDNESFSFETLRTAGFAAYGGATLARSSPPRGAGANSSLVGTIPRSDGKPQVTYDPLYLFDGDHGPGQANGQGVTAFGGGWFALSSNGSEVSGTGSNSGGGGNGY